MERRGPATDARAGEGPGRTRLRPGVACAALLLASCAAIGGPPALPPHLVLTASAPNPAAGAQPAADGAPTSAGDRFVDSVGVNVHLHYNGTLYREGFDLVRRRLRELGVRHVRDGLVDTRWQPYYERHDALGADGIRSVFIVSPETSDTALRGYPSRVARAFDAFEAPNEYDQSRDPQWAATLRATLRRLDAVKRAAGLTRFPTYGPSLVRSESPAALGDVSAWFDYNNMHNYFAGRHPGTGGWGRDGYGSIEWNLDRLLRHSSRRDTVTTETGYMTAAPGEGDWIPDTVAGKYMPRLLLEQFRRGIIRTYLYELADEPSTGRHFGLLTATGTPKPAFRAVRALLSLLRDPGPPAGIPPLRYSVERAPADLRHMAFGMRDGRYLLALWLERPGFDLATRRPIDVAPAEIGVAVSNGVGAVRRHQWLSDGSTRVTAAGGRRLRLLVTDSLQILELQP